MGLFAKFFYLPVLLMGLLDLIVGPVLVPTMYCSLLRTGSS